MEDQHFFYRKDGELLPLYWGDIVYLEAKDNHTTFYIDQEEVLEEEALQEEALQEGILQKGILIRVTLNDAMKLLPKSAFGRVNRSIAIALKHIKKIKGDGVILRTDPCLEFTITKQYNRSFFKQIVILQTNTKGKKKKEV